MFWLLALTVIAAPDWTATADKLAQSLVTVVSNEGSCTGWVLNDHAKGDKDWIVTAAHCDGSGLFADNAPAKVVMKDRKHDLMVLEVEDLDRPAVKLSGKTPQLGEEIMSMGFGYGLEKPMLRIAHISNPAIELPDVEGGPFVMIDAAYVNGQSGGPVVNAQGEIVSIVQRANGVLGIGVDAVRIAKSVQRYLPKS
jgi:S1-C subfamily serine protease